MNPASNPDRRKLPNGDHLSVSGMAALFSQWLGDIERFIDERDRRYDERATAEAKRLDGILVSEAKRVDALFIANAEAVGLATTTAAATAATLAARFDKSAEALAERVESTAVATKTAADANTQALVSRIAPLERAVIEIAAIKTQSVENRTQSNWTISQIITVGAVVVGVLYEVITRAKP